MKYTTFRNLVVVGGLGLLGVGVWQCGRCAADRPDSTPDAAARTVSSSPRSGASGAVEPYLLAKLGKSAPSDKIKDGLGAGQPKVNVYNEGGIWARAKVDLDRDEKWDEKWSFDDGVVKRQVSPADDDTHYPIEYRWVDGTWRGAADEATPAGDGGGGPANDASGPAGQGGETGGAATSDGVGAGEAANDDADAGAGGEAEADVAGDTNPLMAGGMVDKAMALARQRPVQDKIKDTTKGRPFKINIYSDDGVRWSRAKVDLDRDDKWDEKWTFDEDGGIEKQVAPADDDNYTETWAWGPDGWTKI